MSDELTEAENALQYWEQKRLEALNQVAQQPDPAPEPEQQYAPPATNGPAPKELVLEVFDQHIREGAREENAMAAAINAMARAAQNGDDRFVVGPRSE